MEINCLSDKNHTTIDIKAKINHYNNLKKDSGDSTENLNRPNNTNCKRNNETMAELYKKVTQEDLQKLCDQLSAFNARIQTAREMLYPRYDLPFELQEKLEKEARELEFLYIELQNSAKNVETIRNQRAALCKEKICMETQLTKLKQDAVSEMELIVSVYDNAMMEKWEDIKNGNNVADIKNFLYEVKGKLEAMKHLQTLCNKKLTEQQNEEIKKEEHCKKNEKKKANKDQRSGQRRGSRIASNTSENYYSNVSLPFLIDTDSEELLDSTTVHNVLYSLVCEQVVNLPAWTQGPMDID